VKEIESKGFESFHQGIGLLLHDLVLEFCISQYLFVEGNRFLSPLIIFLQQDRYYCITRSKRKNQEIFGIVRTDQHRCLSQCLFYLDKIFLGFRGPFHFISLPEHGFDVSHQLSKILDKSPQKINLPQKCLNLLLRSGK
jgi:hypothetical protein